ncbi:hypothetical protein DH2020_001395 [Rehmannia glutinosa]|uniref:GTD-binding domain-containing protein n=1 Tax=Rehmannia glutinosa TaxID=99300 RepID=A0ABR0XZK9_REHGL
MAAENPSSRNRKHPGFMHLLSSAACEWLLIFLLFVNAALSYLLARFAEYCELKTPCMLCSRLDNGFGKKKPGCYWNLLCNNHREEISSLVSCSVHGKFADVHGMCEECLVPIVRQIKSNSDSYRLLVGKSWLDVDRSVLQNLVLNKHIRLGSPDHRTCSCCSKTWRAKSSTERLLELNPVSFGASKANVKPPLPRAPGRSRFSRRDSLKRLRDKFTRPMANHDPPGSSSVDTLSHVGYTKLKISSDSESEFPFSEDDDDGNASSRGRNCGNCEYHVQCDRRVVLHKTTGDSAASDKVTNQGFEMKSSILDHPNLLDVSEDKIVNSLSTDAFRQHDSGDLDWPKSYNKRSPSLTPDLISLNDGPQPPDVVGDSFGLAESSKSNVSLPHMSALSTDETSELSDRHVFEVTKASDSAKSEEDTKSPPQQATSELGSLSKDTSPRAHDKHDKSKIDEDSSSQLLLTPVSPKKNESTYESLDGTNISDIEGENIVDRLKRQVEHDRNCMNNLYKELEEERNAAAIAANQTMAMITRLQEEKAALHMEALQYLRMMEEQAEYDMEALGRANDLLAEKEKELQDLEIELEFYRNNFLDESGSRCLSNSKTGIKENGNHEAIDNSVSGFEFEDEKVYISECLRKLEKKLHQAYSSRKFDDMPNGLNSEKIKVEIGDLENLPHHNGGTLLNQENEENGSLVQNVISISNGTLTHDKENDYKFLANRGEINLATFEKEIAELYDRLEALESDRNFLMRTSDLLRNGKDGLQLVQEIAHQLQELRKMEFKKR